MKFHFVCFVFVVICLSEGNSCLLSQKCFLYNLRKTTNAGNLKILEGMNFSNAKIKVYVVQPKLLM